MDRKVVIQNHNILTVSACVTVGFHGIQNPEAWTIRVAGLEPSVFGDVRINNDARVQCGPPAESVQQ